MCKIRPKVSVRDELDRAFGSTGLAVVACWEAVDARAHRFERDRVEIGEIRDIEARAATIPVDRIEHDSRELWETAARSGPPDPDAAQARGRRHSNARRNRSLHDPQPGGPWP